MIEIISPGFFSSIQDNGRYNGIGYGVPISGSMDSYAASLSNSILGNRKADAVMEITMTGPKVKFNIETYISITGADMQPCLNERRINMFKGVKVNSGDVLSFGRLTFGFRTYLAVSGGFNSEVVMGSRSMYHGITKQVNLKRNDILRSGTALNVKPVLKSDLFFEKDYMENDQLAVFKGPEYGMLTDVQRSQLTSSFFTISKCNNRMAFQLVQTVDNKLDSIITSPVMPGTVQLTPSGKLIILMRDCQTTGGYPRILQLSERAINCLSQKFTGDAIKFKVTPS